MSTTKFISSSEFERPAAVREKFIGRFVNKLYKHGDQNPVRAFNII